jgi:hypothetical protein
MFPGLETLYLTRFSADGVASMTPWCPLYNSNVDGKTWGTGSGQIFWVDFVGEDYLATVSSWGVLHIWNLSDLRPVATFNETRGLPSVTPDGQKIAFATKGGVALVDPEARSVLGFQAISKMPMKPTLVFDHGGQTLAVVDKTRTILIDLQTRNQKTLYTSYLNKGSFNSRPDLGWLGGYLCGGSRLTDLQAGIPVWEFGGTRWASPEGNCLWAVVESRDRQRLALRSFAISPSAISSKVDEVLGQSEALPWRVGKKVRVDVADLPAERKAAAKDGLTELLTKRGLIPSNQTDLVLKASIEAKSGEKTVIYNMQRDDDRWQRMVAYQPQPARLEIIKAGNTIWSVSESEFPPFMVHGDDQSINAQLARIGEPQYSMFERARLPLFIRDGDSRPLVRSELAAD